MGITDIHSLSHTKWNCKYHIVFAPKYRRKVFYGNNRLEIGKILRELCRWKGVNIITAEVCIDHVHMFVEIPPKMSVSSFMGFLKGKSSIMPQEPFCCRGYYVDTAGKNAIAIQRYIENQLKEDEIAEQLTIDQIDPFTGSKKQVMQVADRSIALKRRQKTSLIGAKEKPLAKLVDNYFFPK